MNEQTRPNYYNAQQQQVEPCRRAHVEPCRRAHVEPCRRAHVEPINRAYQIGNPLRLSSGRSLGAAQVQRLLQNQNQADNGVGGSPLGAAPQSVIDNVFQPQSIDKDPYTPIQRARGLGVRTLPFAVVYIVLAIGIAEKMALSDAWIYLLFGIPMLITVAYMSNRTDRHTPAGVEIERIASAERTEFTRGERQERILDKHLANQQELRRMSLEATIKMLERTQGVPNRHADQ